jgi:hypothetical protein
VKRTRRSSFVYFIAAETIGAVKIGFSTQHPTKRLRAMQTGCPAPLKLLAYAPATQEEEAKLHQAFAPLGIHGEWFRNEMKLASLLWMFDPDEDRFVSRHDFEGCVHDVLAACISYNVRQPSLSTPEYEASAGVLLIDGERA